MITCAPGSYAALSAGPCEECGVSFLFLFEGVRGPPRPPRPPYLTQKRPVSPLLLPQYGSICAGGPQLTPVVEDCPADQPFTNTTAGTNFGDCVGCGPGTALLNGTVRFVLEGERERERCREVEVARALCSHKPARLVTSGRRHGWGRVEEGRATRATRERKKK